jgi:endoglucanase
MKNLALALALALAIAPDEGCSSSTPTGADAGAGATGSGGAQGGGGTSHATPAGGTGSATITAGANGSFAVGGTTAGSDQGRGGSVGTAGAGGGRPNSGGETQGSTGGATAHGGSSGGFSSLGAGGSSGLGDNSGLGGNSGGGNSGSGGSGQLGGSSGTSSGTGGQLSPQEVVKLMPPGWNLGNSFDGDPDVTSWGNPAPTQALINAVHQAGFKTMRLPVTWTDHIGAAPAYTIDSSWMGQVTQTAQWAVDAGMYVFVNTHHESDGNGGWVTFPASTSDAAAVATEVTAVWTQIATAFQSFASQLMFECFNEPNEAGGGNTASAQADLNMYLEACVKAIRATGGANAARIVMIQPIGASPIQAGIQAMQQASIINDPNLIISLHTYYPTNFGLSTTPYAWGSDSDYTSMANSIQQIRAWLPTQAVVIGEWGSMAAQSTSNRAAHALAYAQDTTTAGLVPIWWDNGGSGTSSFAIFDRNTGDQTIPTIVSGIMTGVKNGQAASNSWATLANP